MNPTQKFLQTTPEVFSISLVWTSSTPPLNDIESILEILHKGREIDLSQSFYLTNEKNNNSKYYLR